MFLQRSCSVKAQNGIVTWPLFHAVCSPAVKEFYALTFWTKLTRLTVRIMQIFWIQRFLNFKGHYREKNCFMTVHMTAIVQEKISQLKLKVIQHLPYSSDLAHSNFCLFSYRKKTLRGQILYSSSEVEPYVRRILSSLDEDFSDALNELVRRWRKCRKKLFYQTFPKFSDLIIL